MCSALATPSPSQAQASASATVVFQSYNSAGELLAHPVHIEMIWTAKGVQRHACTASRSRLAAAAVPPYSSGTTC